MVGTPGTMVFSHYLLNFSFSSNALIEILSLSLISSILKVFHAGTVLIINSIISSIDEFLRKINH